MQTWLVGARHPHLLGGAARCAAVLYEAAEVDGATGPWRKLINVTIPMVTPACLFTLVDRTYRRVSSFRQCLDHDQWWASPCNRVLYTSICTNNGFTFFTHGLCFGNGLVLFILVLVVSVHHL